MTTEIARAEHRQMLKRQIEERLNTAKVNFTVKPSDRLIHLTDSDPKLQPGQPFKSKMRDMTGTWVVAKVLPPITLAGQRLWPYEVNRIRGKTRRDRLATIKALQKPFRHTTKQAKTKS